MLADDQNYTILVTVLDQTGAPVPFAGIQTFVEGFDFIGHSVADAQGHATKSAVAGPRIRICADYQDLHASCTPFFLPEPGETRSVTITLDLQGVSTVPTPPGTATPRGWIFGNVMVKDTNTLVPGAVVKIDNTPLTSGPLPSGSYQFPGLSTTDGANDGPVYTVTVVPPPEYVVAGPASQQVTVLADHGVKVDFVLQRVPCQLVLGFQALHDLLPGVIGACAESEQHNPANGDGLQHTTSGLLVWRKADNFTAFTDGYHTWVYGPVGLRLRLNSQRFPWEANPDGLPKVP